MAWWGEGSKRVSDCPLGDEAKERERERRGEKGRLIAPASNSTAGCHPWLGGSEGWGYRRRQLDATVPLDTANSAGSLPPMPGCSGSAEAPAIKCCHVNEPCCFTLYRMSTNPHGCEIRACGCHVLILNFFFSNEIDASDKFKACFWAHEVLLRGIIHFFGGGVGGV